MINRVLLAKWVCLVCSSKPFVRSWQSHVLLLYKVTKYIFVCLSFVLLECKIQQESSTPSMMQEHQAQDLLLPEQLELLNVIQELGSHVFSLLGINTLFIYFHDVS